MSCQRKGKERRKIIVLNEWSIFVKDVTFNGWKSPHGQVLHGKIDFDHRQLITNERTDERLVHETAIFSIDWTVVKVGGRWIFDLDLEFIKRSFDTIIKLSFIKYHMVQWVTYSSIQHPISLTLVSAFHNRVLFTLKKYVGGQAKL